MLHVSPSTSSDLATEQAEGSNWGYAGINAEYSTVSCREKPCLLQWVAVSNPLLRGLSTPARSRKARRSPRNHHEGGRRGRSVLAQDDVIVCQHNADRHDSVGQLRPEDWTGPSIAPRARSEPRCASVTPVRPVISTR